MTYPATFATAPATEPLELTGPLALRLWISADTDDLDVLVRLQHLDDRGEPIPGVGPQGGPVPMAMGWLRASHRETDPELSEPYRPWHPHQRAVPLTPGEPTPPLRRNERVAPARPGHCRGRPGSGGWQP